MKLTKREKEIMDAIISVGKDNVSMKEIADKLGISYNHMMKVKYFIMVKNQYSTPLGLIIDYAKEAAIANCNIDANKTDKNTI